MKNKINIASIFALMAIFVLTFVAVPTFAHAQYQYNSGYNYDNNINNQYHYGFDYRAYRPTPQPVQVPVQVPVTYPVYVPNPTPVYVQTPTYYPVSVPTYQTYPTYSALNVSCSANVTSVQTGSSVTWSAYVSGGNGSYTYSWTGTDNLYGSAQSVYTTYSNTGLKYGTVTVYSNGQSQTVGCSNSVNVYSPYTTYNTYQPVYYTGSAYNSLYGNVQNQSNGLDIGCYADPTNSSINQPITWTAEVTGGVAPYTYSWSGSDDLSGSQISVTKWYASSGSKYAVVSVTSADGKTGTKACSNSLIVKSNVTPTYATNTSNQNNNRTTSSVTYTSNQSSPSNDSQYQNQNQNNQNQNRTQTAASYFSMSNVPWGWVGMIVIIVLFLTVMYLLFNRQKI